uniref:DUF4116 domain-containing protein n=1 Tax=viral metagenome TaxID=1070528 RepID=A0A6C0H8M3_9ZZZZ
MSTMPNTPHYPEVLEALRYIDINILNMFTHENFCTVNISSVSKKNISKQILDVIYNKIKDTPNVTYILLLKNNISDTLQNEKYTGLSIKLKWNFIYGHIDLDDDFIPYYYLQDHDNLIYYFLLIEYYNNRLIANTPINIYINIVPYEDSRKLLQFNNYLRLNFSPKIYQYEYNNHTITDSNILIAIVKNNYIALNDASEELKNDLRVLYIALKHDHRALIYVPENFKKCEKFMCKAIKINYKVYEYIHESLLHNRSILKEVINQYYKCFPMDYKFYWSTQMKERIREQFIMKIIKDFGHALEYVSNEDKKDPDLVKLAVQNDGTSLQFASSECKSTDDIVLAAVKQNGMSLQFAYSNCRSNYHIALAAVTENGMALQYTKLTNYELIATAVKQNGIALQFVPKTVQHYDNIVAIAIEQNKNAEKYIKITKQTKIKNKEIKKLNIDFQFNY